MNGWHNHVPCIFLIKLHIENILFGVIVWELWLLQDILIFGIFRKRKHAGDELGSGPEKRRRRIASGMMPICRWSGRNRETKRWALNWAEGIQTRVAPQSEQEHSQWLLRRIWSETGCIQTEVYLRVNWRKRHYELKNVTAISCRQRKCTDFKAIAATNLGILLSETKDVEQEGCDMKQMGLRWLETVHRVAGEARRKTDRRNNKTETGKASVSGADFGRRWRRRYCSVLGDPKTSR
jgi:hypothetical protein